MPDMVNHPPHYSSHPSGIECFKVTKHLSLSIGTAYKYVYRFDNKWDATEDLKKAVWYIDSCPADTMRVGTLNVNVIRDIHAMALADLETGLPSGALRARFFLAVLEGNRLKQRSAVLGLIGLFNGAEANGKVVTKRSSLLEDGTLSDLDQRYNAVAEEVTSSKRPGVLRNLNALYRFSHKEKSNG